MMDDSLSVKSTDSAATSDEYEFVSLNANTPKVPLNSTTEPPLLKIAGNGDQDHLQKCLGEMLNEDHYSMNAKSETRTKPAEEIPVTKSSTDKEQEPPLKSLADVTQECTLFGCISYLGSAAINAPKSKTEINRNMAILNDQSSHQAIKVSLSIPNLSDGSVVLYDASNNSIIARYDIQRIMYYDNGPTDSKENSCFAFTYCHGDTQETALFQCHVFRCDIPEAVIPLSFCFGKAHQRKPNLMTSSQVENEMTAGKTIRKYEFEVGLEIKEEDGKGNFSTVPRDRSAFKLRANMTRQIHVSIHQLTGKDQHELEIKRCFGFLISRGWNVKDSDMHLLEMISSGCEDEENPKNFIVACAWDPHDPVVDDLNAETSRLRLTLAVDLVFKQIKESVRLPLKIECKIFPQNERFWSFSKGQLFYHFNMYLQEVPYCNGNYEPIYKVMRIDPSESDKSILNLNQTWNNFANLIRTASSTSLEGNLAMDDFSDSDEPMVSGSGEVSKECPDSELVSWTELLSKWTDASARPKQLTSLVKQGIPEALRGEVWQRLTLTDRDDELMNKYRILITKACKQEAIIKKDIFRTFPAHDYFKEVGGVGQDTLFNISKAYAVFDSNVGYYQGLTFIAASLLLHMPEEQAFCVLVRLMFDYKLRDLYKDDFEVLKMKQYQLSRLLEEKDPQLWLHFKEKGIETHMFAHMWFLTLYTARFPLYFVFFTLDVVLVLGLDTIFQIALSLLTTFREDLLQLDFENIVKYIQGTLPKKCRNHNVARKILKRACSIKLKKLKKYEREFNEMKVAHNNVEARESVDNSSNELSKLQRVVALIEEEKRQLLTELTQAKETLITEMEKAELESQRSAKIIADYKQICQRLDTEQTTTKSQLESLQAQIASCDRCSYLLTDSSSPVDGSKYSPNSVNNNHRVEDVSLVTKVTELELELAQTKLALVEAECRNQDLTHQMGSMNAELQTVRNQYPPWLHKTLSSIKEVTANKRIVNSQ